MYKQKDDTQQHEEQERRQKSKRKPNLIKIWDN